MDFFKFYELPISFLLDERALKQKFYALSRQYHPDFHTHESSEQQQNILELSTLNTRAYKTLSDFDERVKYILEIKGLMQEGEKQEIPNEFLMEMMDINESVMDLQMDFDETLYKKTVEDVKILQAENYESVKTILENYDDSNSKQSELEKVKEFYLKKRYLLRLEKNLSTFAPL